MAAAAVVPPEGIRTPCRRRLSLSSSLLPSSAPSLPPLCEHSSTATTLVVEAAVLGLLGRSRRHYKLRVVTLRLPVQAIGPNRPELPPPLPIPPRMPEVADDEFAADHPSPASPTLPSCSW
jgi:hypothetical protein